jgi:DedD protein
MKNSFKQRLLGAVILICIAMILWPVIFSEGVSPVPDRRSQIPEMPTFEKYTVVEPLRVDDIEPAPSAEPPAENPLPEPSTISSVDETPKLDQRGIPEAWVLQVASFSKADSAEELKEALQTKGYKAFTRKITGKADAATRVYVGPKLTRDAFSKDKIAIDKEFMLNTIVVRYEP